MKNISTEQLTDYNNEKENIKELRYFIKGSIIHLSEDSKQFRVRGRDISQFENLLKNCYDIENKLTAKLQLTDSDIESFQRLNKYNSAKNLQFLYFSLFVLIIAVVWGLVSYFVF